MTVFTEDSAVLQPATPIDPTRTHAVVVMGVSGCGKSSVAEAVASALGWPLFEGDSYHAATSVAKMRQGIALTDADRAAWLDTLVGLVADGSFAGGRVLTCSALRRRYRDQLRARAPGLAFAFLELGYDDALARVRSRPGHFFSPALVQDQFATLENPRGEPGVLTLDATAPIDVLGASIAAWLRPSAGR